MRLFLEWSKLLPQKVLKQLDLPEHLSSNSMLKLINSFMDFDDYKREIQKLNEGVKI